MGVHEVASFLWGRLVSEPPAGEHSLTLDLESYV